MKLRLLLIGFCIMSLLTPASAETPIEMHSATNQNLKILSWNIYMLPFISRFNKNGERAKAIADKLENSDYQVIVFQEAFSSKCRNILAKNLQKQFPYQYGPANKTILPFKTNSGLWIVSKIPLKELAQIRFSRSKGFDMVARKGAVLFQGEFHGRSFQLLATHLQADNSHEVRTQQCAEIKEHLLNAFSSPDMPQFICGDFNIDMDDRKSYIEMLQTLDAQNGELSGSLKVTYDEVNNNLARVQHGKLRILDYVLVRNQELIERIERKVQPFFASINGRETNLSDHYAVEFSVNFNTVQEDETGLQLAMEN